MKRPDEDCISDFGDSSIVNLQEIVELDAVGMSC